MYTDWKATDFGGNSENNTKWIEVGIIIVINIIVLFASNIICMFFLCLLLISQDMINQAISTTSKKVKYPSKEYLIKICYNALSDANNEEFQNKIKHGRWRRFYNKHIRSLVSRY